MARRKKDLKMKKVPNILDSYIKFRDLEDDEFVKAFGGTKETIINSWLYLLYVELKQQFESEPGAVAEEGVPGDSEDVAFAGPEEEKAEKRKERRQRKRKQEKEEGETEDEGTESESSESEDEEDLYGIKEGDPVRE